MKKLKSIVGIILIAIISLILTLGIFVLTSIIQTKLFVPEDYMIWILKSPYSRLGLVFQYLITFILFDIFNKEGKFFTSWLNSSMKKYKKPLILTFLLLNIILIYTIIFNVTVIADNKIIDYRFLSPRGNEYTFNDIKEINTGVYGKEGITYSKGDFYYIVELNDGVKIDLAEIGGTKNDEDHRFIIEKLDIQYVNMGISKISSMDNFEYSSEHLDTIYTDRIRNILENINIKKYLENP